jgi:hypothetical protein
MPQFHIPGNCEEEEISEAYDKNNVIIQFNPANGQNDNRRGETKQEMEAESVCNIHNVVLFSNATTVIKFGSSS